MKKQDCIIILVCIIVLVYLFSLLNYIDNKAIQQCINNNVDYNICLELKH